MNWMTLWGVGRASAAADGGAMRDAGQELATLEVHAVGFRHARGHAEAKLYREGENVLGPAWRRTRAEVHDGAAVLAFDGLPPGRYAVVVFHDENDNQTIDHNLFRLPAEPLGFSNGFALSLLSGKPTFEKLAFRLAESERIEVPVR